MKQGKAVVWHLQGAQGFTFETTSDPAPCPKCGAEGTICALPPWLLRVQPDGTTHVCHPALGGCNHGFARAT